MTLNITVRGLNGYEQKFLVDPDQEAIVLKLAIEEETGIPAKSQVLILAGKQIPDNLPLGALTPGIPILLVFRK